MRHSVVMVKVRVRGRRMYCIALGLGLVINNMRRKREKWIPLL